eukprot:scaffold215905_cov35-Tisochrysis_lutea.AAC.1
MRAAVGVGVCGGLRLCDIVALTPRRTRCAGCAIVPVWHRGGAHRGSCEWVREAAWGVISLLPGWCGASQRGVCALAPVSLGLSPEGRATPARSHGLGGALGRIVPP